MLIETPDQAMEALRPPPRRGPAQLLPKQMELVGDTSSKIIIFRGGYRSGKTTGLVAKAIDLGRRHWPHPVLAVEPSFPMIRQVFVDTAMRLCQSWGLACRWQEAKKILTIGRRAPVQIWCRSADAPRSLEGLTVGSLVGDEWELWDVQALTVAMARVSIGPLQQVVLGGTPEGYGPGWQLLEKNPQPGTRIIVSKTTENFLIRSDYADDMRTRFSEEEAAEKLDGVRTAPGGRVFSRFDEKIHCGGAAVEERTGRLEVWAGFSSVQMVWLFVLVDDLARAFHVVGEITSKNEDSEAMAEAAKEWIARWIRTKRGTYTTPLDVSTMAIPAICDANGQRRSSASLSHVVNVSNAGFSPKYGSENPNYEDRIASIQKVLADVRLTVDSKGAPLIAQCFQQARKGNDGRLLRDGHLELGISVIGNGVMWHSPAYRPDNAFMEARRRDRHIEQKKPPLQGMTTSATADVLKNLHRILAIRLSVAAPSHGVLAGDAVADLGCSLAEFAAYIEARWQVGMTWDNHGRNGWHLDHVRPLASFDLTDRTQFCQAAHYSNHQPLWAADNLRKGSRWRPDSG